mmetsp:Transcript_7826/g.14101  ORF Transcript_7826/g.14101 Transcript_7826/m.14101 type:complete len:245 (-) Transcript_7826:226-960(-)
MRSFLLLAFTSVRSPLTARQRLFTDISLRMSSSSSTTNAEGSLLIDPFCYRQFSENEASHTYGGSVFSNSMESFTEVVNQRYDESNLKEGYAPFCKHIFLLNDFTDARVNVLPITPENEHCLRTKYEARNEKELPVLARHFPQELVTSADKPLPVAKYLDLILYSREQINKENAAMNKGKDTSLTAPWGIISIKAQDVDYELPMNPITILRNALGKEEGGSGIPIDREAYMAAYNYWKDNASIS